MPTGGFIAPLFAPEYRVAALDMSGHGDSDRRESYPRDMWAREVIAVARDMGCAGPPVVVGHSMGRFVTIATAAEFGDQIAGAVVLDSPVRRPDPEEEEGARGKAFRNPKIYPTSRPRCATFIRGPNGVGRSLLLVLDHRARCVLNRERSNRA